MALPLASHAAYLRDSAVTQIACMPQYFPMYVIPAPWGVTQCGSVLPSVFGSVPSKPTASHSSRFVCQVEDVLSMTVLRPHEELLNAGTLVQYEGGSQGSAMFISHQWAGSDHPDPFFEQFKILQEALRKMMSSVSNASGVNANILVEMMYAQDTKRVTAKELTSQPLFLWYDYFSCPQIEEQIGKTREQAISSIAAYVEKCQYFVVLCPHVRHAENEALAKRSWESRGWCRLERAAEGLRLQGKTGLSIEAGLSFLLFFRGMDPIGLLYIIPYNWGGDV